MGVGLRVLHLNIRSLLKNFDELFILFQDYDMILLSETWLNNNVDSQLIHRKGFSLVRQDRDSKINKRGGGLAIYIKSELGLYTAVMSDVSDVIRDIEQLWVKIEAPGRKFLIVSVMYRPPAGNIKKFMLSLKASLNDVSEKTGGHEHLILGDFNIDFGHMESSHSKDLRDLMAEFGLQYLDTTHTRVTSKCKSKLDLMFSDLTNVLEYGVKNIVISDHLPTYLIRKKKRFVKKIENITCRKLQNYLFIAMEKLIRDDIRWHDFWKKDVSVDDLWAIMYSIFLDALNMLCPLVNRNIQVNAPDWVTKEGRDSIREKNQLYTTAKQSKAKEDWVSFRDKKKSTAKLIVTTKCNKMKDKLNENRGNPKKFWRHINSDILGKGDKGGIEVLKDMSGYTITGLPAAEFANIHFANMGKADTDSNVIWDELSMNMERKEQDMSFTFVELLEVHQLVIAIDIHKASGIEGISTKILKDCLLICEFELSYLFNCSLHNTKFPSAWKNSIITPIYKSGDKLKIDNWRPINNLCVPGKLLEKCVYRRIEEYMEKNNFLCKNQHGFRKGKGTDTAVMELARKLFTEINANNTSSVLFLDYSRAFNTVDHSILLRKLSMYGMSGNVCKWFADYFVMRTQYTQIGTVLSSGVKLEHGVYQGSPLGPLLFIIYINDLVRITDATFCNMYADDTVIVSANANSIKAIQESYSVFARIREWCDLNMIKVNKGKTKHMLLGNKTKEIVSSLNRAEYEIDIVEHFSYLGVILDNRLSFEKFVNSTISRVNGRLITFARIRKFVDSHTSLLIYKQTILPILDYMSIVVNSSTKCMIKKLQPLQNRAIRIIEKRNGYISTVDMNALHLKLNLKQLHERRYIFMLKMMYKLSQNFENVNNYRPEMLLRTAPKVKMKIEFTDKERVRRSPYHLCSQLWDKIDSSTQTSKNIVEFSRKLRAIDVLNL